VRHLLRRPPLAVLAVGTAAVLALSGCGGDEPDAAAPSATSPSATSPSATSPSASSSPSASGSPSLGGGGDPEFCAVAADDTLDTAQPGTQEYADGTAALADAAPPELTEATETLRTLGQVQLGLGTDGTAEELEAAMTEQGIDAATLLGAFAAVGKYIDTCDA